MFVRFAEFYLRICTSYALSKHQTVFIIPRFILLLFLHIMLRAVRVYTVHCVLRVHIFVWTRVYMDWTVSRVFVRSLPMIFMILMMMMRICFYIIWSLLFILFFFFGDYCYLAGCWFVVNVWCPWRYLNSND